MRVLKVLDLFCGAGGAAIGLHRAWPNAEIIGVDIVPQPRYPFKFVEADAMTFSLEGYDFIWASPPCQHFSCATPVAFREKHPDLILKTRIRLEVAEKPFVIENVPGALRAMRASLMLCGTMFGMKFRKHRYFEISGFEIPLFVPQCNHRDPPFYVTSTSKKDRASGIKGWWRREMAFHHAGLEMMRTRHDARQAVPPIYSEFIARQFA